MTLMCSLEITGIAQIDNPTKAEWRDESDPPVITNVRFKLRSGFSTPRHIMPQIRQTVAGAEPNAQAGRVNYDTRTRLGNYHMDTDKSELTIGQVVELPILTYLRPPQTADEIVAALQRDPDNLVIHFYTGDAFATGWIQPDDHEANPDARTDHCQMIDHPHIGAIGKLLPDDRLAFDCNCELRLASVVKTPMSRAGVEEICGEEFLESIGWTA